MMRGLEELCTVGDQERLHRFRVGAGAVVLVLCAVLFLAGTAFLKESVFKHWFNPSRHVIVEQDPLTYEILAWRDALGNVYTPDDWQVRAFPYAVTGLVLLLLGCGLALYSLLVEHYLALLVLRRVAARHLKVVPLEDWRAWRGATG